MLLTLLRPTPCGALWGWNSSISSHLLFLSTDVLLRNFGYSLQLLKLKNMDLGVLVSVLLAGVIPDTSPWKYGMEWFGSLWQAALPIFSGMRRNGILPTHCLLMSVLPGVVTNCQGDTVHGKDTGVRNRRILYPLKVVLSDPKRTNWPSRKIILDATRLGGGDLPSPSKADITVRTDKHKQNILYMARQ